MARFNREFLIPYLQNICALYQARRRIDWAYNQLWNEVRQLEQEPWPAQPYYEKVEAGCGTHTCLLVSLFFGFCTVGYSSKKIGIGEFDGISALFLCLGLIAAVIYILLIASVKEDNDARKAEYQRQTAEYPRLLQERENKERRIPTLRAKMEKLEAEAKQVDDLIQQLYRVNIIPSHYRDIYGAFYLYDWFATSQADDIDMALVVYNLEQIQDRLDRIIALEAEKMMNQRISIAIQYQSAEAQKQHAAIMEARAREIAAGIEEQNTYLHMIEQDTATMTYFATAEFFKEKP